MRPAKRQAEHDVSLLQKAFALAKFVPACNLNQGWVKPSQAAMQVLQ